mgnify:FL=1
MPKTSVSCQIENFKKLQKQAKAIQKDSEKILKSTLSDLRKQAPAKVRQEVATVYNFDKKEITPGATRKGKDGVKKAVKQAASFKTRGETIDSFALIYTGRLLTPVHFGMTPKVPPSGRSYTLKMQVYKGKKEVIGRYKSKHKPGGPFSQRSHNILMKRKKVKKEGIPKEDAVKYIPFQRVSKKRTDLRKFTSISMPQMIENPKVNAAIYDNLAKYAIERLDHHSKRFAKD